MTVGEDGSLAVAQLDTSVIGADVSGTVIETVAYREALQATITYDQLGVPPTPAESAAATAATATGCCIGR